MAETKLSISSDTNIGQLIEAEPRTVPIIEKYFGKGCFTCPGIRMESLAFGSTMHNVDVNQLIGELMQALAQ